MCTDSEPIAGTYKCDCCGACCRATLIIEADEIDFAREPRLMFADPYYRDKPAEQVARELGEMGRCLIIACGTNQPCLFLGGDNKCTIYPTRPNVCVAMQAGDEQCQAARAEMDLPPLLPVSVL